MEKTKRKKRMKKQMLEKRDGHSILQLASFQAI